MEINRNSVNASSCVPKAGLSRRQWVQRVLAGAGAGVAAPAFLGAGLYARETADSAAASHESTEWKPAFFNDHQNRTVIALAESIVPGSTGAQVNRFLDTALGAETSAIQQRFIASLNAMEGESIRRFTEPFKDLSTDQQRQILAGASAIPASDPAFDDDEEPAEPGSLPNLRDYFEHLKTWVSMAYYSSEIGMKELGWTGESFFESLPECEHAGAHS